MPRREINGLTFHIKRCGHGIPLILLHGFTGSTVTWTPFTSRLASNFDVVSVDLIGHGNTDAPVSAERYSMDHAVADLSALLDNLEIRNAHWLGYSMGGRVALQFALAHPDQVRSLILEGVSPGIENRQERDNRKGKDDNLADRIERDGLELFVSYWESIPLFASQRSLPQQVIARQRSQRLANDPVGLANSLRGMGQGTYPGALEQLSLLTMPILLVVGQEDTKFQDISTIMAERMESARVEIVSNAGHTVHLEQPDKFVDAVERFLGEQSNSSQYVQSGEGKSIR